MRLRVAAFALLLSPALACAQAHSVATSDDLSMGVSADGGVTSVRIGDADLPLRGAGRFSLADYQRQPEPVNLITNPGFEQGTADWGLLPSQHLDREVAHSGAASMRIEIPGPEAGKSSLGTTVSVKPGTRYICGLWIMRRDCGVTGAYVSERDDANKLTGTITQIGRTVPKADGVWHHLIWELRTQPATTRLNIRGDIYNSTGTIWLDDFLIGEVPDDIYTPIQGRATAAGDAVRITGGLPDTGLELEATLRGDDECIRVDGVVRDTTGDDRAVGVRFALPLDAEGWTWYDDASEARGIEPAERYAYTYKTEAGAGECSIYPWSAISGPDAGLTFALPVSQGPRIFVIEHNQRAPRTTITFYFGLSADAGQNPSRAPFSFVIYRHDPAWGMRSAMERYYRLFPESFVKRMNFEGYLNYANLESFDPVTHTVGHRYATLDDAGDFGEGYKFLYHVHGCYDFRMVPYDDPKRPSDEWVISALSEMVEQEKDKPRGYVPSSETLRKLVYDSEGHIRYIGDTRYFRAQEGYNHNDWPGWGLNFRVNEDPDVSDHISQVCTAKLEDYAATDHLPWDACVTADAIEGYHSERYGLNYRREHWATTLLPLTFGRDSLAPAMSNNIWDFHHKYWWPTTDQHQVAIYGNSNGYHQIFTAPYIDVPMIEGMWDRDHWDRFERYLRAVSHHKTWRWWRVPGKRGGYGEDDPEQVRRHFAAGLAYAIYPCMGVMGERAEKYRAQFRQYVPAIEELSIAGWEPVPYATTDASVIIERYGSYEGGELHLALRNYSEEEVEATVTLDLDGLGIPARVALVASDVLPGFARTEPVDPGSWTVTVPARDTRAFWVGATDQVAAHAFRQAALDLGRIERMYHTELTEGNRALIASARDLAERGCAATTDEDVLALASQMNQAADDLLAAIETEGTVDLAKLVYRLKTHLSGAATGALGLDLSPARLIATAPRGGSAQATWTLKWPVDRSVNELDITLHSPWPEVVAAARESLREPPVAAGAGHTITARLPVPADPPRELLPFLVEVAGVADGLPFSLFAPADVVVGAPLAASVAPQRVFRGAATRVRITLTNHLPEPGAVTMTLRPPSGVTADPAEFKVDLPAAGAAGQWVTLTLAENARIGDLTLPWSTMSEDPRLVTDDYLMLQVSDPVPTVGIARAPAPPEIDGALDDPVWQGDPVAANMNLLRGGKPATEQTSVWMSYDDAGVYIAFRCAEAMMSNVKAQYTERGDPLYKDDDVEVFLLPLGARSAFQFAVNSLGTISDNFGNEADWRAAAKRYEDRWTVEIFIPYEAVEVAGPPERGVSWAAQFGRQQKPKAEVSAWTPGTAFNRPEGFGVIMFD